MDAAGQLLVDLENLADGAALSVGGIRASVLERRSRALLSIWVAMAPVPFPGRESEDSSDLKVQVKCKSSLLT